MDVTDHSISIRSGNATLVLLYLDKRFPHPVRLILPSSSWFPVRDHPCLGPPASQPTRIPGTEQNRKTSHSTTPVGGEPEGPLGPAWPGETANRTAAVCTGRGSQGRNRGPRGGRGSRGRTVWGGRLNLLAG